MPVKLGLISDVHASPASLQEALDIFAREKVSDIVCAGDVAGYFDTLSPAIELLQQSHCKTIVGNHDQEYLERHADEAVTKEYAYLQALPQTLEFNIQNKSIYVVHAEPPSLQHGGIKLLDQQGGVIDSRILHWNELLQDFEYDVLIVGHTHQVFAQQLGSVFVVNPGSTVFNHSCMVLSLPDLNIQTFALENRPIIKCWNFSMLYGSGSPYPNPGS
jgi:putative phosphoesterase